MKLDRLAVVPSVIHVTMCGCFVVVVVPLFSVADGNFPQLTRKSPKAMAILWNRQLMWVELHLLFWWRYQTIQYGGLVFLFGRMQNISVGGTELCYGLDGPRKRRCTVTAEISFKHNFFFEEKIYKTHFNTNPRYCVKYRFIVFRATLCYYIAWTFLGYTVEEIHFWRSRKTTWKRHGIGMEKM